MMGKVMAGLLSISALMFSSYTGNEPVFRPLQCRSGQNYLIVTARLENAFDNDFADVFKCGKPISLYYKIELRQGGNTVQSGTYRHTVTYDPMNATWELYTSENGQKEIYNSYLKLLNDISVLECSLPRGSAWRSIEIRAEAWLQQVELTQPDRRVDLMVLWKFKRPAAKRVFNLPPTS